ncbi:hypothetical protein B0T26DRAFT_110426 [Lasiosphaeria miniovina]|uniref:Amine oxidase domain-containing protein n=1 Tax=Lasiosphaeria miniovina TaxID=1954250 RepID=A0AA40B3F8_9PEZI|nr:uncharacterized protein B0T26DRAFT_110426 [Lasiosphaeria miniovina]KAK0726974.1 hypothetical protein B0T26DRAFT_110426 [Lasiosphaeria miniovina]
MLENRRGHLETVEPSRKPHIGVIGAGLAGLRCADVLLRHGFRVTILEARDRLGGRMYQERLPNGHLVDVGPNWVHGTTGNPMMDLARETDTPVGTWDTGSTVYDEDGELISSEDSEFYSTTMWNIIEDAFDYSNQHGAETDPSKALLDFFREQIPHKIPDTEEDYEKKRSIMLQMATLWGNFVGSPVDKQSLKFFWLEECLDGENLFCAGTYEKILQKIAQPAVDGADIRYQTRISEIYGKSTTANNDLVNVKTTDGHSFEFNEVVVAAPLGWLKQNPQAFIPPLPPRMTEAIQSLGYGCLEKVYISFQKAFWLTPDASGRTVKGFAQWLSPKYAPDSNPARWTNEIVELASLAPSAAHPTLLFYIYGDESHHVTATARALPAGKERDEYIFAFFKPYYSRLPSYDEASADCRPTCCLATDWLHDDLAGNGSYTNFQVGLREGDKDVRALRAAVPAEGVWLAGEHTAPFVALGTVTGAYWSGEDVGKRLGQAYGRAGFDRSLEMA